MRNQLRVNSCCAIHWVPQRAALEYSSPNTQSSNPVCTNLTTASGHPEHHLRLRKRGSWSGLRRARRRQEPSVVSLLLYRQRASPVPVKADRCHRKVKDGQIPSLRPESFRQRLVLTILSRVPGGPFQVERCD